jgi:hypothetical protein
MSRALISLAMGVVLVGLAGCEGGGGALAGTWTKSMSGEGDVKMTVGGGGAVKVELPSPRWPADVDVEAKLRMVGDSLEVSGETGPSACKDPAPKYHVAVSGTSMTIGGGSADPCPARHAVLVGTWTKS